MPTGTTSDITRHSFAAPAFERAKVLDATYRIHSVVVAGMPDGTPPGGDLRHRRCFRSPHS